MSSIINFDHPDPARSQLLDELKSISFFNVALNPDSKFHITAIAAYTGADTSAVSGANYLLTDDFTMIGKTHLISFPVSITFSGDS